MIEARELDKLSTKEGFYGVISKEIDTTDNCITGEDNNLLNHLREAFKKAKKNRYNSFIFDGIRSETN